MIYGTLRSLEDSGSKIFQTLHYVFPPALFLIFVGLSAYAILAMHTGLPSNRKIKKGLLIWGMVGIVFSYVCQASSYIARSLLQKPWWAPEDQIVYVLSSILVWGTVLLSFIDTELPAWYVYCVTWFVALFFECVLVGETYAKRLPFDIFQSTKIAVQALRVFLLLLLLGAVVFSSHKEDEKEDSQPLLSAQATAISDGVQSYGAVNGTIVNVNEENDGTKKGDGDDDNDDDDNDESQSDEDEDWYSRRQRAAEKMRKRAKEQGNWWNYSKQFLIFIPLIFPKERKLQINIMLVGLILFTTRFLNVLIPRQLGIVTDSLTYANGASQPLVQVSIYMFYRWLSSSAGISALQTILWLPIELYSYKTISETSYNHMMSLSHDFHSSKSSGELFGTIAQGRSVTGIVETVVFKMAPMAIDLVVAVGYLYWLFGSYVALVVATVVLLYFYATSKMGKLTLDMRKKWNQAAIKEYELMWESMTHWQTVSLFNRLDYEKDRYSGTLNSFVGTQKSYYTTATFIGTAQALILTMGLLSACFLAVYQVTNGKNKVGDFVTLLTYWAELSYPLSFFADFARSLQSKMIDAEKLMKLLHTKPSIIDKPEAKKLIVDKGEVTFDNVEFSYDKRKSTLKGISLDVPGGTSIALVGQSGGGKTTCLKLLFRFYDVLGGSIKVDGQDVRDVTVSSLREAISVVPQDPELFNVTIMENIRYANLDASDEEVYDACKAAAIHDKIMEFPDGYNSKVGHRGVKLSGGELQRVAIARALLRNTKIVLLDEATSMVDMKTERMIQTAFKELGKNRTMFVIAHRLSTIINVDKIVVFEDGKVAEQGSHQELFAAKGKYYELWQQNSANVVADGDKKVTGELLLDTNDEEVLKEFKALIPQKMVNAQVGASPPTTPPTTRPATPVKNISFASYPSQERVTLSRTSTDSGSSVMTVLRSSSLQKRPSSVLKPNAEPFVPPPHVIERLGSPSKEQREFILPTTNTNDFFALGQIPALLPTFSKNENKTAVNAVENGENVAPFHKRRRRRSRRGGRNQNRNNSTGGANTPNATGPSSGASTPAVALVDNHTSINIGGQTFFAPIPMVPVNPLQLQIPPNMQMSRATTPILPTIPAIPMPASKDNEDGITRTETSMQPILKHTTTSRVKKPLQVKDANEFAPGRESPVAAALATPPTFMRRVSFAEDGPIPPPSKAPAPGPKAIPIVNPRDKPAITASSKTLPTENTIIDAPPLEMAKEQQTVQSEQKKVRPKEDKQNTHDQDHHGSCRRRWSGNSQRPYFRRRPSSNMPKENAQKSENHKNARSVTSEKKRSVSEGNKGLQNYDKNSGGTNEPNFDSELTSATFSNKNSYRKSYGRQRSNTILVALPKEIKVPASIAAAIAAKKV